MAAFKGVTGRAPLHTLRKEFGSLMNEKFGIYAASRALRHGRLEVTSAYYTDSKSRKTLGLGRLLTRSDTWLDNSGSQERRRRQQAQVHYATTFIRASPTAEWDFSQLPKDEAYTCCIYEYGRSSAWFVEAVQDWRIIIYGGGEVPRPAEVIENTELIGATMRVADLLPRPRGFARVVERGAQRLANGGALFLRSFPDTPWLSLDRNEKRLAQQLIGREPEPPLVEGYKHISLVFAMGLREECRNEGPMRQFLNAINLYAFYIDPESTRNQVVLAFKQWLAQTTQFSDEKVDARKTKEKSSPRNRLRQLAVSRLRVRG